MVVTIIGSTNVQKESMEQAEIYARNVLDAKKVFSPLKETGLSPYAKRRLWLKHIDESDLIILVPKVLEPIINGWSWEAVIGESTTYEFAYAKHVGKEVMIWAN